MFTRHYRSGYSLLELVTVVGIAGVTASLALPGLSYVKERRGGEYDAEYLAGKLRHLRSETLQANASVRLDILPVQNKSGVYRLKAYRSNGHIGRTECHDYVFDTVLYDIEWDLKSGYHVYADTDNGMCFYPGGGSSGGSIYMTDAAGAYRQLQQSTTTGDEASSPPVPYLAQDTNPQDFELHLAAQSVRARVDVPLATGIPDVVKSFVAFTSSGAAPSATASSGTTLSDAGG